MVAFHGKQETKEFYLNRVREHRAADQLIQNFGYWGSKDGKFVGCAVGCTLHSGNHAAYETELGIPRILARLEDSIFERLPAERAQSWPEEFLTAATAGADLSMVWPQFALWLLKGEKWGVINFARTDKTKTAIEAIAALYVRQIAGDVVGVKEWRDADADDADADADDADADDADDADADDADAYAAAYAAAAADAAAAAADAAYAYAAAYAAYAAAAAAAYAYAAAYDGKYNETRLSARLAQADKLLELMSAATLPVAA